MVFVYLLMALFGVAAMIFATQNPEPVSLTFLGWKTLPMPLSFVILISAFIGVVVASVSAFAEKIQLQRKMRALERQVAVSAEDAWPPAPVRETMRERFIPDADSTVGEATVTRTTVQRTEIRPPL